MHPGWKSLAGMTLVAPALLILTVGQQRGAGDEPGRLGLGRFFRFGSPPSSSSIPGPDPGPNPAPTATAIPGAPVASYPATSSPSTPSTEVSTPVPSGPTTAPRIVPRPRVSRPVTESHPIVGRITVNRSDDGNQFGMFLQVYADGTVIDGEGVHRVGIDVLRPILQALEAGDLYRVRGHCGAPATDFVESVQVIVYERVYGRLRAS